jgi:regulator of sigma E protease
MIWLGAIVAIGLLIVVHEAGHYVVARLCKMRVDRFSIGFGPGLIRWGKKDTEFQLAPLPFGGYVQIRGMNPAEEVSPDDPYAYPNRPVLQRFATIFAGPGTNYLFAVVLAIGLYAIAGIPSGTSWYEVRSVEAGFDAQGKLVEGDRIVAVDGDPVYFTLDGERHTDLPKVVNDAGDNGLAITVLRDGERVTVNVTPKLDESLEATEGKARYRLGIGLSEDRERVGVGVGAVLGHAVAYPVHQTGLILSNLYGVITGRLEGQLAGPVGIATVAKQQLEAGWIYLIQLLMVLNVYLGLFNLLPLPALDGGRLAFLTYEMATRRRPNPKVEAMVHMVGIMALLVLMVLVTYNDIARLF